MSAVELRPGQGTGAPVAWSTPDHQPIVPLAGGVPPRCTCGFVGGRGRVRSIGAFTVGDGNPSLAEHGRDVGGMA